MSSTTFQPNEGPPTITITVTSDPICPWCYIGTRRLDLAISAFRRTNPETRFRIRWKPFFLNRWMRTTVSIPKPSFYRLLFPDAETYLSVRSRIRTLAEELDLRFEMAGSAGCSTRQAHKVLYLAGLMEDSNDSDRDVEMGGSTGLGTMSARKSSPERNGSNHENLQHTIANRLFHAHFCTDEDISSTPFLMDLAREFGLERLFEDGDGGRGKRYPQLWGDWAQDLGEGHRRGSHHESARTVGREGERQDHHLGDDEGVILPPILNDGKHSPNSNSSGRSHEPVTLPPLSSLGAGRTQDTQPPTMTTTTAPALSSFPQTGASPGSPPTQPSGLYDEHGYYNLTPDPLVFQPSSPREAIASYLPSLSNSSVSSPPSHHQQQRQHHCQHHPQQQQRQQHHTAETHREYHHPRDQSTLSPNQALLSFLLSPHSSTIIETQESLSRETVSAVPTFEVDGRYHIGGAQGEGVFLGVFGRAAGFAMDGEDRVVM